MTGIEVQPMSGGASAVRDAARVRGELPAQSHSPEQVHAVLRLLPSHGWTAGWVGRRDRALLVLSQLAGLSYAQIAALTGGDLTITDGVAKIRTPGGTTTLHAVEDDLLCGPCALARWVHALDLTVVYPDGRVIAAVIARAVPLTADSPHLCHSNNTITEVTRRVALVPPIDQWGHPIRSVLPRDPVAVRPLAYTRRTTIPPLRPQHRAAVPTDASTNRAGGLEFRVAQLLDGGASA